MIKKKIAIIGAGYAGVAVAWFLLQTKQFEVTLFDLQGIAGGASGLSAGLLHPYAGAHSKLNANGQLGMSSSLKLLEIASRFSARPIFQHSGILRLAVTDQQKEDFMRAAESNSDIHWCSIEECQSLVPGSAAFPGIQITSGCSVYARPYLEALWKACESLGARFEKALIQKLSLLKDYNHIVATNGMGVIQYTELSHLILRPIKGQLLELEWPKNLAPLSMPLNSSKYLTMTSDNHSCIVGATFERSFDSTEPDLKTASEELLSEIEKMYPPLVGAKIVGCRAGIRASSQNHLPLAGKAKEGLWYLTGLGSKGLLYHAWLAERLANAIADNNPELGVSSEFGL